MGDVFYTKTWIIPYLCFSVLCVFYLLFISIFSPDKHDKEICAPASL